MGSQKLWQTTWSGDITHRGTSSSCPHRRSPRTVPTRRAYVHCRQGGRSSFHRLGQLLLFIASLMVTPTFAVFVDFQNCLSQGYQHDQPLQLQFDPLYVNAVFNTTNPSHNLNITVWGNVTGSGPKDLTVLPPANSSYWSSNSTSEGGKIENVPDPIRVNKETTLFSKVNVLTYEPWSETVSFCAQLINASCPLSPSFTANA
jgi:hypothetical protein